MKGRFFAGLALLTLGCGILCDSVLAKDVTDSSAKSSLAPAKERRGIVLYPSDVQTVGARQWVEFMKTAGINLLGIHADTVFESLPTLQKFIQSPEGITLLAECNNAHIEVEYELHILQSLLPRELFTEHPEYFPMDKDGQRKQQFNMCFTCDEAYNAIEAQIHELTRWLNPTTHRYLFWTDDVAGGFCHCDNCQKYTPSEQALLYENRVLGMLRKIDPEATVAHLAYSETLPAPVRVQPLPGIFMEYAPFGRDYTEALSPKHTESLRANLAVFPPETVHILEYWLDGSMASGWNKEALKQLSWDRDYCQRDIAMYQQLGAKSITTFAAWLNEDYIRQFGRPHLRKVLNEYGVILRTDKTTNK